MRGIVVWAAAAAGLAACDLDFVEVETDDSPVAFVSVRSEHADTLRADVKVDHGGVDGLVAVRVDGSAAALVGREDGTWTHEARVVVDSLQPVLEVEMEAGDERMTLDLPLLARSGPAVRTDAGDLHLPVVRPPVPPGWRTVWDLDMLDASGNVLLAVRARVESLPVVVSAALVPAGAVRAELRHRVDATIESGAYTVGVLVSSETGWEIP